MNIVEQMVAVLNERQLTITTVESCTGGFLINALTSVEGASNITSGAYVTYSNEQKIKVGVPSDIIKTFGVYSRECAEAMALTGMKNTEANISIGVTGTFNNVDILNSDSKQGVVYFAIALNEKVVSSQEINVPLMKRSLQKEYVADAIFEQLNRVVSTL